MDLDQWKQLDNLLQSALELSPEERDAFLRQACGGNEPLERQVRALLNAAPDADRLLERPAIEVAALSLANDQEGNPDERPDALIGRPCPTTTSSRSLAAAAWASSTKRRTRGSAASSRSSF